ncbi:hypothetical protein NG271_047 [Saccharomyces cerevisiae synthetic construct]|uniref:Putative uncharacterized protein YDL196W n=1 Tax=Saccharomyces cerevisiae (strain ATCC 204508 / S288c) TaxID=559292 RepID=YDL96_YEAST|nr:RecName: Full=Putative uncharacterized protein YDL196W [Saccharomyces cerevisiae S288C]QHB07292.1 hypothetical protein SCEN_D00610 [Saccharomyces cerevisiae]WNF19606.1 hypothetical protein NG271_047 [Saccharomyces cerevisiae synthetic construct]CAA58251.1 D1224 [Saccharomyces cerevisiae]CAA98773.1 unnamed protein product [Saccharomyces cerevisiae]
MPSESRKRLSSKKGATVRLELVENYVICFFTVLCFCLIPHSSIDWRSGLSCYYFIDFFFFHLSPSIPFWFYPFSVKNHHTRSIRPRTKSEKNKQVVSDPFLYSCSRVAF